jgi:hypothetical protein
MSYVQDQFGFHQVDPQPYIYTQSYQEKLHTDSDLALLRLGFLSSVLGSQLKGMSILDYGCGNGKVTDTLRSVGLTVEATDCFNNINATIKIDNAVKRKWDLLLCYDVIEHMPVMQDIFKFEFTYGHFSLPNRTDDINDPSYIHLKPNEHLHHLNFNEFTRLVDSVGTHKVIKSSNYEDLIRVPKNVSHPNIQSHVLQRRQ